MPSLQLLRELGRRLGVSEDYLATGQERPPSAEQTLLDADLALRLDETDLAERLYGEALEGAASESERARALSGLGQLAFRRGDPREAIAKLEQALALSAASAPEQPALADTLGRAYATVGEFDAAIGVFEQSLEEAKRRGDRVEQIRFAVLLANALIDGADFSGAETVLADAVNLAEGSRDPLWRARLYWSHSRLRAEQDDPGAAARYARKALGILELTEHDAYTARAHQLLAHVELDRGKADEALSLLERGWPLLAEGSELEKAQFLLEKARALSALGQREEAAALAMRVSGPIGRADPVDAGRSYGLLADIFVELGERARARELYELAVKLLEPTPNRYLAYVYRRLAEMLEEEGRTEEALAILKRAVHL